MTAKPRLRLYAITDDVARARMSLLRDALADDDYTIRLWNAEAKLAEIGFSRGKDGFWRKKITAEEVRQMALFKELGQQ